MSKYKVLGFMSLHYAGDYFRESLLAIRDHVQKFHIAYSIHPSQGHGTDLPNPDKEEDMRRIAEEVLGDKLIWDTYPSFDFEGKHRNERYRHTNDGKDYDIIFTIDADEVVIEEDIPGALDFCMNSPARFIGITGFTHFYRSFDWAMTDHWNPIRLERLGANNMEQQMGCPMRVLHFSYAQRAEILEYKFRVSGHKDELQRDYLHEKWYAWSPEKVEEILFLHPSSRDVWGKAFPYDKTTMPQYLKDHKYYNMHLIK